MKKCKNCSRQKSKQTYRVSYIPSYQIANEYGIKHYGSSPKIRICNDEYMLQMLIKNQKKTRKLDKQVHKMKHQIRRLKHSLQHVPYQFRNQRMSHVHQMHISNHDTQKIQQKPMSRRSSVSSSKNRQIGRFTRVSEGDSQSFSKNSVKQIIPIPIKTGQKFQQQKMFPSKKNESCQKPETVSFSKKSSTYLQNTFKPKFESDQLLLDRKQQSYTYSKNSRNSSQYVTQSIPQKDIDQQFAFDMYLPSYRKAQSSQGSNFLENNNSQILSQKARLQRQFEELIILEKNANIQDKKAIREQIRALSHMLQSLQD